MGKFLNYFSQYGIAISLSEITALFITGTIPKSWIGARPLLGSKNMLTSVLRGLLKSPLGKTLLFRALLIPAGTAVGTFIGYYNVAIMIQAVIYAI